MIETMLGPINHVGVAVPKIGIAIRDFTALFGSIEVTPEKSFPEHGVSVCFINTPRGAIELLEPLGDVSPIDKFLARNPRGGQHHICFEVPDLTGAVDLLKENGAQLIDEGLPRLGALGTPVVFLHPRNACGVLIELMEIPAAWSR